MYVVWNKLFLRRCGIVWYLGKIRIGSCVYLVPKGFFVFTWIGSTFVRNSIISWDIIPIPLVRYLAFLIDCFVLPFMLVISIFGVGLVAHYCITYHLYQLQVGVFELVDFCAECDDIHILCSLSLAHMLESVSTEAKIQKYVCGSTNNRNGLMNIRLQRQKRIKRKKEWLIFTGVYRYFRFIPTIYTG